MFNADQLKNLSSQEFERDFEFGVPEADDTDSLWQDMINMRARTDGRYRHLKFRGGSEAITTIAGEAIFSSDTFSTDLGGGSKQYYVLLTESGKVFLYENGGSPQQIMGGFAGNKPVYFINNGKFLYAFEFGGGVQKYYDLISSTDYDFHSTGRSKITGLSFSGNTLDKTDNVFGFNKGNTAIIIPTATRGRSDFVSPDSIDFTPFVARIDDVKSDRVLYKNIDRFSDQQKAFNDIDSDRILPYNADLEDLISLNGKFEEENLEVLDNNASIVALSDNYTNIEVFRSYIIVDILNDGSAVIPSRPEFISINEDEIISNLYNSIDVTIPAADTNVAKRYLCATRWQYSTENASTPSSEQYPNSPYFICSEIDTSSQVFNDTSDDKDLIRTISSIVPISAGIPLLFNQNGISFHAPTQFKGSLIAGNYTINRPVPNTYNSKSGNGNCFVSVGSGTNLTGPPTVSMVFEYTDGKKSGIVNNSTPLTNYTRQVVDTPAVSAFATAPDGFLLGDNPANTITYKLTINKSLYTELQSDSFTITQDDLGPDGNESAINKIYQAILDSNITDSWVVQKIKSTVFDGIYFIRLTYKTPGTVGNGFNIDLLEISRNDPDVENFTGYTGSTRTTMFGEDKTFKNIPGNYVQVHSLNQFIRKVYVLINKSGTNRLFKEFDSGSSYFCGDKLYLPDNSTDIDSLPVYGGVSAGEIQTQALISSGFTLSIPFQEFRIDRQYRIDTDNPIKRVVPMRFDTDKSQLRYQMLVVTESDLQLGYLMGSGGQFNSQFETIHESIEITNAEYVSKVGGVVFFQTKNGLYRYSNSSGIDFLVSRDRYSVLENPLRSVCFNDRRGEFWFAFADNTVLVFKNGFYRMRYPQPVASLQFSYGDLSVCVGGGLYRTDTDSLFQDIIGSTTSITGEVISNHLTNELTQLRMFEYKVHGKDADCTLYLDNQIERYEDEDGSTWVKIFDADLNFTQQELEISGSVWTIYERAIMPRFKIEAVPKSVSGFISEAVLKGYIVSSKNVAQE